MIKPEISFNDFEKLDIRVGTILSAKPLEKARNPAYVLTIDFGPEIGVLKSSAQITNLYTFKELIERQVIAVINFPLKQIGTVMSKCLVLGLKSESGVVLLQPDRKLGNGVEVG